MRGYPRSPHWRARPTTGRYAWHRCGPWRKHWPCRGRPPSARFRASTRSPHRGRRHRPSKSPKRCWPARIGRSEMLSDRLRLLSTGSLSEPRLWQRRRVRENIYPIDPRSSSSARFNPGSHSRAWQRRPPPNCIDQTRLFAAGHVQPTKSPTNKSKQNRTNAVIA